MNAKVDIAALVQECRARLNSAAIADSLDSFGYHNQVLAPGIKAVDPGVVLCGLATDFCVTYSALDAARLGYKVTLLEGACRAIDLNGSLAQARKDTQAAGVVWAA